MSSTPDIAIIGVGLHPFGRYEDRSALEMGAVAISRALRDAGVDFSDVDKMVKEQVLDRVDHTNLNDFIENPTAENIATWMWHRLEGKLPGLAEVRLWEIPTSCVVYRGPGGKW